MSQHENSTPMRARMNDEGVPPPPRFLLWLVIGAFALLLIAGAAGLMLLQTGFSMAGVLTVVSRLLPIITALSIALVILFRQSLPRRLPLIVIGGWALLWLVGGAAFALYFRNNLAPGQRETVKNILPFMEVFAPPLPPADTSLPTPVMSDSGISPEELLNAPLNLGNSVPPNTPQPVAPTALPTPTPTAQPTEVIVTTQPPTTALPTTAAIVPTSETNPAAAADPAQPVRAVYKWLTGFRWVKQDWNNCGPANITMALSYYGWQQSMDYAASFLRPDREDKNVSPSEMVTFVREQSQVRALTRIGGDMELLKQLINAGFPVVVETVLDAEAYDWIGHYETIVGYDDTAGAFYIYDSFIGTGEDGLGRPDPYEKFDQNWQDFNRAFIVLYRPEEEALVARILGERADVTRAAEIAAEKAQAEARANPNDAFAWYNLGSALTQLGQYEQAANYFDVARRLNTLPWRLTLYTFDIFEAYFNVGRYDDVLALVEANKLNGGQYVEETYYWQGRVLAAQGNTTQAAASFRQALARNPRFAAAQTALDQLSA